MQINNFDDKVRVELQNSCQMIFASEELKLNIDKEIRRKEIFRRKRFSKKTLAFVASIACLFITVNSFAVEKKGFSYTFSVNTVNNYKEISEIEKGLDYNVKVLETFTNGYTFKEMSLDRAVSVDENSKNIDKEYDATIIYEKAGEKLFIGVAGDKDNENESAPNEARVRNGITFNYSIDTYKVIPADYELTEEDKENMKKEHYYISRTDIPQVQIKIFSSLYWIDEGVRYIMFQFDSKFSIDDLIDMANQVMESQ